MKTLIPMSTDDVVVVIPKPYNVTNSTVVTASVFQQTTDRIWFYVAYTDEQSDENSESSHWGYTKYKYFWNDICPITLVDRNSCTTWYWLMRLF